MWLWVIDTALWPRRLRRVPGSITEEFDGYERPSQGLALAVRASQPDHHPDCGGAIELCR